MTPQYCIAHSLLLCLHILLHPQRYLLNHSSIFSSASKDDVQASCSSAHVIAMSQVFQSYRNCSEENTPTHTIILLMFLRGKGKNGEKLHNSEQLTTVLCAQIDSFMKRVGCHVLRKKSTDQVQRAEKNVGAYSAQNNMLLERKNRTILSWISIESGGITENVAQIAHKQESS